MAKKKKPIPNRIAEWRARKGLSQEGLAKALGTTQPTIARLEKGVMELTETWMREIAKAVDCEPTELLGQEAIHAELRNEVEPHLPEALSQLTAPLAARHLFYYKVLANSLERAGIHKSSIILFDMSAEAVAGIASGDIVLLRVLRDDSDARKTYSLLRQYVAPGLFVTNRNASNFGIRDQGETFTVSVRGVLVSSPVRAETDDSKK